jgi:multiple sugar transport system substrate-binding protein
MGLLFNRKLFTEAGLNPNEPPTTWAEVRADAKKISALGNGIVGYADYSTSNQGGWHFTTELYSLGGTMVTPNGLSANFNNALGREVLLDLHNMRWVDKSMGTKQLLQIPDLEEMMGANQLGMYVAAPDNIPTIVQSYGNSYDNIGISALPGTNGPAKATLLGGGAYLFNVHDTAAQIRAGIKFLEYEYLTPGVGSLNYQRTKAQKQSPVGLPEPDLWTGQEAQVQTAAEKPYLTEPTQNFQLFENAMDTMKAQVEPPDAQQIYSVLDGVMSGVLTDQNYNIESGLRSAASQVNSLLENYFG